MTTTTTIDQSYLLNSKPNISENEKTFNAISYQLGRVILYIGTDGRVYERLWNMANTRYSDWEFAAGNTREEAIINALKRFNADTD